MDPIPFPEANTELKGGGDVMDLPVFQGHTPSGEFVMISKYSLTTKEVETLKNGGHIYLWVYGSQHPPVAIGTEDPFKQPIQPDPERN